MGIDILFEFREQLFAFYLTRGYDLAIMWMKEVRNSYGSYRISGGKTHLKGYQIIWSDDRANHRKLTFSVTVHDTPMILLNS